MIRFSFESISLFREYLPRYKGGWTPDSGPIVLGIGIGASGLALKTAASLGDTEVYDSLNRIANPARNVLRGLTYVPLLNRLARLGADLLASSIKFCAESAFQFGQTKCQEA